MSINRLKQLEKRLSKKLDFVDERSKWKFPVEYSIDSPRVYFVMKWQNERFERVEATKEEADEYNRDVADAITEVFLPEESNEGVVIFKPEKNKE